MDLAVYIRMIQDAKKHEFVASIWEKSIPQPEGL
jgi:hypothetical protein